MFNKYNGKTALHIAAYKGHISTVEKLLKFDANIKVHTKSDENPLHLAAQKNHVEIAQMLILHTPTLAKKLDYNNKIALHYAAEKGNFQIIKELISKKANINGQDNQGKTFFDYLIKTKGVEVVKQLIDQHLEVFKINHCGEIALKLAIKNNNSKMIGLLSNKGFQPQDYKHNEAEISYDYNHEQEIIGDHQDNFN